MDLMMKAYHQLWDGEWPPFLAQGHISEEGADRTVSLLRLVHKGVGIHKDLNLHGLVAREGHAPGDGDHTACGTERSPMIRCPDGRERVVGSPRPPFQEHFHGLAQGL